MMWKDLREDYRTIYGPWIPLRAVKRLCKAHDASFKEALSDMGERHVGDVDVLFDWLGY